MGCLISILCIIFFPVIYFWYQFRRARQGLDEMVKNQMNRQDNGSSSGYSSASRSSETKDQSTAEPTSQGASGIRKPHIFKPGEGEYVDYKEVDN